MNRNTHSWCWGFCLSFATLVVWLMPPIGVQAAVPAGAGIGSLLDEGIVGRPGEWIFYPASARQKAFEAIHLRGTGELPDVQTELAILHEGEGSSIIPLDVDDGGEVGSWKVPCETSRDQAVASEIESEVFQGEDGEVLVATALKTMHLSILSTHDDRLHILGLRLNLVIDVDSSEDGFGTDEVDLVFPIEAFRDRQLAYEQFDGLAHVLAGKATDCVPETYCGPVLHEGNSPKVLPLDCSTSTDPGTQCFCACWSQWRTNMEDADDTVANCMIAILGLKVLGQIVCGFVCLKAIATGGVLAPACVGCFKFIYGSLGGAAALCLAIYGATRLTQFHQRRQCIAACGNRFWNLRKWTPPKFDVPSLKAY